MYQLGLTPDSTTAVPRMSLALGANRWASKVVVVLQLAAWTAVGIVLLQKGVASLQKNSATVSASANSSLVNKPSYNNSVANLLMKKVEVEEDEEQVKELDDDLEVDNSTTTTTTESVKYAAVFEVTKRFGSHSAVNVGGGTAAAAVAMVAVGAVMLVLGPAVIILRALDERRQERRFLKLSGQDDLPPSYEQATLMDEAPRYSTLSLNTILNCTTIAANGEQASSTVAIINSNSNGDDSEETETVNSLA